MFTNILVRNSKKNFWLCTPVQRAHYYNDMKGASNAILTITIGKGQTGSLKFLVSGFGNAQIEQGFSSFSAEFFLGIFDDFF